MLRKVILSILGLALIIGSISISNTLIQNKNRPKPVVPKVVKTVFVDTVKNSTVPIIISANGNTIAKRRVELFSEVQGVFKSTGTLFKAGQSYKKGQRLIHIDASEYYASVQAAKSNLYNDIAAIMPDLRLDFPEIFPKWKDYLLSFDLKATTPELPEITSDKENYFITGRGIVSSYYNVKNLEQRLTKYYINAPFSGVLTEALVTEGTLIRNGQKLGEFIDTSEYEIEIAISKSYAPFIKEGEEVILTTLNGESTFTGVVSRVNASIDLTTQTITAFINVKHPNVKEGMYFKAEVSAKDEDNAIEIDRVLLSENNTIFAVRDSVLESIDVKPVFFSDKTVVLKNVEDGTVILKRPVPGAYSGMLVKPYVSPKN